MRLQCDCYAFAYKLHNNSKNYTKIRISKNDGNITLFIIFRLKNIDFRAKNMVLQSVDNQSLLCNRIIILCKRIANASKKHAKVKKEIYKESKLSYILSRRYTRTREKTCFLNFEKKRLRLLWRSLSKDNIVVRKSRANFAA